MDKRKQFKPESLMMSYGYRPELSEGAIKSPIFMTSTFVFKSAQEGKDFFEIAYGLREKRKNEEMGLIYSRINNPDLEILENRLTLWDDAEDCAVFESGMSAISTVLLEYLSPGDLLVYSTPLYGGTDHFIHHFLTKMGIESLPIHAGDSFHEIQKKILDSGKSNKLSMIYLETPANPTNSIFDIGMCRSLANQIQTEKHVTIAVDNTYMGPLWQKPLMHGADCSIYSATKYIGGHSDVIAGAVCGTKDFISRVKTLRTFLGNMASPHTGWLLMRSLETLKVRMERQSENAVKIAKYLQGHPQIEKVYYLGAIKPETTEYELYKRQYSGPGAMMSFNIKGGEKEAFQVIDHLKLIKLAVSLGGTESLVEHPYSMTHAGVEEAHKLEMGITPKMIRLSVGVEDAEDLIWDLDQALKTLK